MTVVQNFPGPYELRIFYTNPTLTPVIPHSQRLSLALTTDPAVGTDFSDIDALTKGGISTPSLDNVVEAWLALIAERLQTTVDIPLVELWRYTPLSFDATFIAAYVPMVSNGLSVSATQFAAQEIFTFRTIEGGVARVTVMEGTAFAALSQTFPTTVGNVNNIAAFAVSSDSWILARDTSYLVAAMRWHPGQNERLFKARFRP